MFSNKFCCYIPATVHVQRKWRWIIYTRFPLATVRFLTTWFGNGSLPIVIRFDAATFQTDLCFVPGHCDRTIIAIQSQRRIHFLPHRLHYFLTKYVCQNATDQHHDKHQEHNHEILWLKMIKKIENYFEATKFRIEFRRLTNKMRHLTSLAAPKQPKNETRQTIAAVTMSTYTVPEKRFVPSNSFIKLRSTSVQMPRPNKTAPPIWKQNENENKYGEVKWHGRIYLQTWWNWQWIDCIWRIDRTHSHRLPIPFWSAFWEKRFWNEIWNWQNDTIKERATNSNECYVVMWE